jgi:putative ABC transport system permease protein
MKRIWKFIRIALTALWENKTKALLTMLGIIIGIGAVILIISIGKGAEKLILSSVESFGPRSIFVQPGGGTQGGPPSVTAIDKVKYRDYLALQASGLVEDVTPLLGEQVTMSYLSEDQNTFLVGTNQNYPKAINFTMDKGRFIEESDVNASARVTVLGYKLAETFFGDQDPIGQSVKVKGKNFQVIGVAGKQGTRFFQDFDTRAVIPVTTMKDQIKGVDYLSNIMANVPVGISLEESIDDVRYFVRNRHAIYNPEDDPTKDDFKVISQVDAANTFQSVSDILTLFLVAIAAISLLVGGIGIMNIMFVSVSERTREIGLRKAVGASSSDVLLQFLIEASVLTMVAGVIGVVMGVVSSFLMSLILQKFVDNWQFIISLDSVVAAFIVSVGVGLLFGIYPARNAAKLNPIEALRQE